MRGRCRQAPNQSRSRRRRQALCLFVTLGLGLCMLWNAFPYSVAGLACYPASTYLLDRHGSPLRVLLGPDDRHCDPVSLEQTGEWAWKALVAVEDKRFFRHPGVDLLAIARAFMQNLTRGRVVSGASTLSNQVIRMTEPRPRHIRTKGIEAFRALQMEAQVSKQEILTQYLNRAPMGGNLEGIAAASQAYFSKMPGDLSLAEAALLAGLPQSPSRFQPVRHPDRARTRRDRVLGRMRACGMITDAQYRDAVGTPIQLRPRALPFRAPHFAELARRRLAEAPRSSRTPHRVRTSLDPILQQVAEEVLRSMPANRHLPDVDGGALVILDVATGAVRALAGSPNFYGPAGQVNGAIARRSPGSALKPFAYALALDRGQCTPETIIQDTRIAFRDYQPENFDRQFSGAVTVRQALARSLNIPALRITRELGVESLLSKLRAAGLHTLDQPASSYGLSLVLGTAEVTLLDLTAAYGALARGGRWIPARIWEKAPPGPARQLFSPEACYLVADILEGSNRLMDVCGHAADVALPRVAWKTGTSSGQRDAWAIAYNPEYVVGVWIGHPDGRRTDTLTGAADAAPLAYAVFRRLYPDGAGPWFVQPERVVAQSVCTASGRRPDLRCKVLADDLRIRGVSNPSPCRAHDPDVVSRGPRIQSPVDGAHFRILAGNRAGTPSIALSATAGDPGPLHWFLDGAPLGQSPPGRPFIWNLEPGFHTLACSDPAGQADTVSITVEPQGQAASAGAGR